MTMLSDRPNTALIMIDVQNYVVAETARVARTNAATSRLSSWAP